MLNIAISSNADAGKMLAIRALIMLNYRVNALNCIGRAVYLLNLAAGQHIRGKGFFFGVGTSLVPRPFPVTPLLVSVTGKGLGTRLGRHGIVNIR